MTILLRMDDKMNRQLTCQISLDDTAIALSHELVHLGFINDVSYTAHLSDAFLSWFSFPSSFQTKNDREKIASMIEDTLLQTSKQQQLLGATRLSTSDCSLPMPVHSAS